MWALLTPVVGLAIKLIMMWIGANEEKKELKRLFLAFLAEAESLGMMSVKLKESDKRQTDELRERRKRENAQTK